MIKKLLLPLLMIPHLSWAQGANTQSIVLDATEDFSLNHSASAPYYIDKVHDALAIDARVLEYRNLFAYAATQFNGESGEYDVRLTILTEEDGEPIYRLWVDDKLKAVVRAPYIGEGSDKDLKPVTVTWQNIKLQKGAQIALESNTNTNGEIPEHGGTAWARGRWQTLELLPSENKPLPRVHFNRKSDLLIAQFDLQPDADDVHSIAALGSMLKHKDLADVNLIAVSGTTGTQTGPYFDASQLMTLAFGKKHLKWFDAKNAWSQSVKGVTDRVKAVFAQGGRVWVQEAGQSDFTRDWVEALIEAGISRSLIKNNVIVVQHSNWNEQKTTAEDLAYVKKMTNYQPIADGNKPQRKFIRKNRRGPVTPMYVDPQSKWIASAILAKNSNAHARALWQEAVNVINKQGFTAAHSSIPKGGVDFSDVVEDWWILELGQPAASVHAFWERYVTDVELDSINPPSGRLAVVADGNSPDPDDIGASPVMFAMLQKAGLSDRLVHFSHSCDLDPFKNKAVYQIDPLNEARRQTQLHFLTGKSIELFGPFKKLDAYYNCRADQAGATKDLVNAINQSSAEDPLWIIEAGEPDLIGYALQAADAKAIKHVHVVSHHPANDDSGDYFTWQQILDFGVTEHQIGDQNIGLQTPIAPWDWAKDHKNPGYRFIWQMLDYAERDGIVPFQTNKFDCSDAGMVYWWITGADQGGNKNATAQDIKALLSPQ